MGEPVQDQEVVEWVHMGACTSQGILRVFSVALCTNTSCVLLSLTKHSLKHEPLCWIRFKGNINSCIPFQTVAKYFSGKPSRRVGRQQAPFKIASGCQSYTASRETVVLFHAQWGALSLFSLCGFEKEVGVEQKRKCGGGERGRLD